MGRKDSVVDYLAESERWKDGRTRMVNELESRIQL